MLKIFNLIIGLIYGLILGLGIYFLSVIILCLPWPPPTNVFSIRISAAMLRLYWAETIRYGSIIGGVIGFISGISSLNPDATLSRTGIQCWGVTVIIIFINHWRVISKTWLNRLVLLTPLSLFLSFLFFMIAVSICEPLFKRFAEK